MTAYICISQEETHAVQLKQQETAVRLLKRGNYFHEDRLLLKKAEELSDTLLQQIMQHARENKTGHEVNNHANLEKEHTQHSGNTEVCSNKPGDWPLIPLEENTLQLVTQRCSNTQSQYWGYNFKQATDMTQLLSDIQDNRASFSEQVYWLLHAITSHTIGQPINTKTPALVQEITGGYRSIFTGFPCYILPAESSTGHPWDTNKADPHWEHQFFHSLLPNASSQKHRDAVCNSASQKWIFFPCLKTDNCRDMPSL